MILALVARNSWRHKLRTGLTVLGMVVSILAFGLLQTVVSAWYAGADAASDTRLVTRNAISLVFPMPVSYEQKIKGIAGVRQVAAANWFGAIYKEPKNFFPQFAVSNNYFELYPEYLIDDASMERYRRDQKACIIGRKLANQFDFKLGDVITLKGTIFSGEWSFVVAGIYEGQRKNTDTSQFFFHWDYLNETMKIRSPRRANQVGVFVAETADADHMGAVALAIDEQFKNSPAETLSETEKAFQLGFVSMTGTIVVAIKLVSYVVIFIIMAVMANTMAMTARERTSEYATLKALGFSPLFVSALIFGESLMLALLGGVIGVALSFPVAEAFGRKMGTMFPVFNISGETIALQFVCALTVGILAALLPARRAATVRIVEGLRAVG